MFRVIHKLLPLQRFEYVSIYIMSPYNICWIEIDNIIMYRFIPNAIHYAIWEHIKSRRIVLERKKVEIFHLGYNFWHTIHEERKRKKREQSFSCQENFFWCDESFEWFNFIALSAYLILIRGLHYKINHYSLVLWLWNSIWILNIHL